MSTTEITGTGQPTWRDKAPRSIVDPLDSQGKPISTPTDRRWLWRLEMFLAVSSCNETQRQMADDLRGYLHETCEHHWLELAADDCCPEMRQCIWCYWTDSRADDGTWA